MYLLPEAPDRHTVCRLLIDKTSFLLTQEISPFLIICFPSKSLCCVIKKCESIEISKQCRDFKEKLPEEMPFTEMIS